jgi:hypothetical protein
MRHRLSALVAIVLAVAGCASTGSEGAGAPTNIDRATTSLPTATSVPATSLASATSVPATSLPPTSLPATTAVPAAVSAGSRPPSGTAAITPVVVCFDSVNGVDPPEAGTDGFYFGYDNAGVAPAVIPAGPGNSLSGASVDDAALAPTALCRRPSSRSSASTAPCRRGRCRAPTASAEPPLPPRPHLPAPRSCSRRPRPTPATRSSRSRCAGCRRMLRRRPRSRSRQR